MNYEPRLVHREVSKAATLGLLLDPQLGEAHLLPSWKGKTRREEPQLHVGYRGLIKLARQSGEVATIYAHEVHEHDVVECDLGVEKRLVHKPVLFGERGKVIGYYAVIKYRDGSSDFEPMTLAQVHWARGRSDHWCAFKAGKIATTAWATDEEEMGKKTVIKRLLKRVPQSPDLASALGMDEELAQEPTNVIPISQAPRAKSRSISDRLDTFANRDEEIGRTGDDTTGQTAEKMLATPKGGEAFEGLDHPLSRGCRKAMERGRTARHRNRPRKLPKGLTAPKRRDEAEAYLRGWEEENFELRAEEYGSL
jgi:recombination protein RecT